MGSAKDDYIRDILAQVDNVWVRKRLKAELEAHFDDALENLSVSSIDSIEKVKAEMGSPEAIAKEANNGHPSIRQRIQTHFNQGLMALLAVVLIGMGSGMVFLFDAYSKTQIQLTQLKYEVISLNHQIETVTVLKTQVDALKSAHSMLLDMTESYIESRFGSKPVTVVYNPPNVTNPDIDISIIEPTDLPLRISFLGALPESIVIRQNFGILTFSIKNGTETVEFLRYELMTLNQLEGLRSSTDSGIQLTDHDWDLNNGLYIVWTPAADFKLSVLSEAQRTQIDDFIQSFNGTYIFHS